MTAIENRRRQEERRKATVFRRPFHKKTATTVSVASSSRLFGSIRNIKQFKGPLQLTTLTASVLRLSVSAVLQEHAKKDGGCTVWTVVNALLGDPQVRDCFAKQETTPQRSSFFGIKLPKRRELNNLRRRYAFTEALKHLEIQQGVATRLVNTFEEAKAELETVFIFPDDDDVDDTALPTQHTLLLESENNAMTEFTKRMKTISLREKTASLRPSQKQWQELANTSLSPKIIGNIVEELDASDQAAAARLAEARKQREALQELPEVQEIERKLREREAQERASALLRPLTDEESTIVEGAAYDEGNDPDEVMAESGTERVIRRSMQTLRPGCWLNDEVIHFFLLMLAKRDEEMCTNEPDRKRTHFFKSFFLTKLLNEGHNTKDGEYEYKNVKRWTKKVPGKDIFKLNKIVFPINQGNMHWVCAVAFMQEKKIAFFDSMGSSGSYYLGILKRWITDEHKEKKGSPLPDADSWELVTCDASKTPQQRNGFDCGVFTCMFADFISKDCPLVFDQNHIKQCRERIAIAIMKGKAII